MKGKGAEIRRRLQAITETTQRVLQPPPDGPRAPTCLHGQCVVMWRVITQVGQVFADLCPFLISCLAQVVCGHHGDSRTNEPAKHENKYR